MPSAIALNCTLKPSAKGEPSSTDKRLNLVLAALRGHRVETRATIRVADHEVKPGVTSDEGNGDEWPDLRRRILKADILLLGTPIWLGQPSSIAKRVLERMDAFLSETDDAGRTPAYGKVALAVVVGNEDGAHHASAELFQALNDVGWTIPAAASVYWVGEAMQRTDFKDLEQTPGPVAQAIAAAAANAAHLAALLTNTPYSGQ